jgi:MFS transporter, DHA3 family, tetracycline resistance protein
MPETRFHHSGEVVSTLASTTRRALIGRARDAGCAGRVVPGLVLLFTVTALFGMWSESFDRLWSDHFLTDIHFPAGLRPGLWFGLAAGVVALLAVGVTGLGKRQAARSGGGHVSATLAGLLTVTCVAAVGMVLAHQFALAIVAYLVVAAVRPVSAPLINGWMVTRVDARVRATALSARDMCDSAGQIAGGPVFGLIGTIASIRVALFAGAAVLVPAVGLLAGPGRGSIRRPEKLHSRSRAPMRTEDPSPKAGQVALSTPPTGSAACDRVETHVLLTRTQLAPISVRNPAIPNR